MVSHFLAYILNVWFSSLQLPRMFQITTEKCEIYIIEKLPQWSQCSKQSLPKNINNMIGCSSKHSILSSLTNEI